MADRGRCRHRRNKNVAPRLGDSAKPRGRQPQFFLAHMAALRMPGNIEPFRNRLRRRVIDDDQFPAGCREGLRLQSGKHPRQIVFPRVMRADDDRDHIFFHRSPREWRREGRAGIEALARPERTESGFASGQTALPVRLQHLAQLQQSLTMSLMGSFGTRVLALIDDIKSTLRFNSRTKPTAPAFKELPLRRGARCPMSLPIGVSLDSGGGFQVVIRRFSNPKPKYIAPMSKSSRQLPSQTEREYWPSRMGKPSHLQRKSPAFKLGLSSEG